MGFGQLKFSFEIAAQDNDFIDELKFTPTNLVPILEVAF